MKPLKMKRKEVNYVFYQFVVDKTDCISKDYGRSSL